MLQGRVLCRISLLIILIIALSTYAPWDFLGVYDKAKVAETYLQEQEKVLATGYVYHKEIKNDKVLYYVKNASVTSGSGNLSKTSFIFKFDSDEIPTFCKLNIQGKVKHFSKATNEGAFDMKDYYNSLGLYFELTEVFDYSYKASEISQFDLTYKLRKKLAGVYSRFLPGEEAGFLSSVVIGEKGSLDMTLKTLFQNVGIAHVLAVSGLHVSVVCMGIYSLLRRRGISFRFSALLAGVIAIFYGFLTGGSISSVRAIGMFLIFLGAQVIGESYDMLTSLAMLADYLLLQEPLYIKNVSFIFSFGAVIAIFYFVLPLVNVYTNYCRCRLHSKKSDEGFINKKVSCKRRLVEYIVSSFIFSFGIFVAMLPLVTQLFYQTPLYGVLLNLIVLPLMPVLLGVGIFAGILGLAFLPVGGLLLVPCHFIIYFYEILSDMAYRLPVSTVIVGKRNWLLVACYYIILGNIIYGFQRLNAKKLFQYKRKILGLLTGFFLLSALWLIPSKGDFEIDFIDVGQGDGIYINSGDGAHFFIDGGSTSSDSVGQYTMLPFLKYKGIGSIDYWFVSHMDLDHVSGVLELLEQGYRIKNIVLSSEIPAGETLDELLRLAKLNKTNIIYMSQGESCGTRHLSFQCVYPYPGMTSDDVNDLSLCLLMKYDYDLDGKADYSGFFGGDIAVEQEQAIASSGAVGHVDLLKVSHHGSRFSSDSTFLEALSPDIAVISCSKVNRYGHPSNEAIERLKAFTNLIYYTMDSGRIRITKEGIDLFIPEK